MLKSIRRVLVQPRTTAVVLGVVTFMLLGAGCAVPSACVGGIGICKTRPIALRYVIIDPSGSQSNQVDRQVADVIAIANRASAELTIVLLGERPATSRIVTRVPLPEVDASDPNAVSTRTALVRKLEEVVAHALARPTTSSDQWGALQLVHDDARQRALRPGYDVTVLGDSEPCVPGVCWARNVPTPSQAVQQVQQAYGTMNYEGMSVTFLVGGDARAAWKSPSYVFRLSAAIIAVCKSARADSCTTTTHVAELIS